jgi:hypothetical protein
MINEKLNDKKKLIENGIGSGKSKGMNLGESRRDVIERIGISEDDNA